MKVKKTFLLAAVCMMISSLSVLGMPFVDFESGGAAQLAGYAMGLVFWLFLAAGFVFYRLTYKTLGKSVRISDKERPAILKFFSNRPAIAADVLLIVSIVWNVFSAAGMIKMQLLNAVFASLIFIAFHMHYMLNGKAFEYMIRNLKKED